MKNNFKFLIVLAILLTACICIGSTFAADVSVNDIDNTTDLEIVHDDSSQKAVELNNLHVEKTSFNQDNDIVSLNSDNRADVNGSTFEDIQNSITSSNMEIYLHNKTYNGSSQININYDNITIYGGNSADDGLSSTLDAKGLCRIMYLSNSVKTITFVNIKFINGNAYNGGAIYVNSSVTIPNTGFVDNNVTISAFNTSFVGNNATNLGGAIYAMNEITVISGGIYSEVIPGSICISGFNNSFNDNFACSGGAIYSYKSNMTINGTDTKFISNTANGGGAIYNFEGSLCISGVNTSFINNNATSFGGAIYVDTPSYPIASMCISGVNTIFRGNAAGSGGAIYSYSSTSYKSNVTINGNDTKFINNSANSDSSGKGGAIYMYNGGSLCISGVNTSFIDNYANNSNNSFGGAICTDPGIMYISGVNTSFTGNRACYGGAIYVSGDNYTIEGSIFRNNNASYDVYAGERGGGAIYIAGNYHKLRNCTFINNTASGLGIETSYHGTDGGSAVLVSGNNNTIDSCIFINNTVFSADGNYSGEEGGAVFIYANYTTLKNCTFNNNDAPCAGAVFVCGNYTMIEWCNFTNNVAVGNGTFDGGGAIYLYISTNDTGLSNCTIINCNFINNSVNGSTNSGETKTTDGGAIYSNMDYVTISYSYFEGNFAQKGGAIRMHGDGDNPIYNCSFTGNRAVERGGAVYLADSIFRNLTDCNFTNNSVTGSKSFGGAINIQLGMINNCNFINNSARYGGGAIMWDHTYAATEDGGFANNCTFIQNTAHQGSAIYFDNVVNSTTLTNVSFINNTADSKEINIDCNQSEGVYKFIITHYGFNNILDAIYFKWSDSTTKNITIDNVTYYPSNEDALKTEVITSVTFICLEGNETLRIDSDHPYVLNASNSTYKHPIKVIATYDGPLYTNISNSISFNYETEISIGDFSGLTLSNVTSTVNVHIKGDSNATINNTTVNVTLSFIDHYVEFTYNYTDVDVIDGKMTIPLPTLGYQTNNVTATLKIEFNGNSTYNASNGTTTLNISKRETTMDVSVISDHCNFEFYVKLPENATGTVHIFGDNFTFHDMANLTNGTAHFNITNLTPGNYESHFTYDGDDYFKSHSQDFNFTVYGAYSSIEANVSSYNLSLGDNLTVYGTVYGNSSSIPTGNVTICLSNGENYTVTIDGEGKFSYSISGLNAGNYSVTVKYNGDSNYTESSTNLTNIIVNQGNPTVNVVINPDIISFGENVTITGNVTGLNDIIPTGNVTIFVNGTEIANKTLTDGKFSYSISDLDTGVYNISVVYNGDCNYTAGINNSANLTVSPVSPQSINVAVENIAYGENATVNIAVTGLADKAVPTGNVTVFVNGSEVANVTLDNGKCNYTIEDLSVGVYNISVRYNGDINYTSIENSTKLTVIPKNITILTFINETIYSDNLTGNINTNLTNKSGNISVIINGTVYNGTVGPDGSFILNNTDSLNAGHYGYCPVSFISADGNYIAEDDCAFNIIRKNITINATINNITYGDNLSGSVNADLSGRISIYPGDGNFSYEFDTIGPFTTEWEYMLSAGTYEAGIIFLSDNGNYQGYANVSYTINKTNSTITINVDDINYGENVTVNGTVIGLEDATIPTGNVTILVNNTEIANVTLINGKFNGSIPDLATGDYNITVIYNGDNNYNGSECRSNVTINKADPQVTVDIGSEKSFDIKIGDTVVAIVGVPGDATGTVSFSLDNKTWIPITIPEDDNLVEYDIPNLDIGDYILFVKYSGDKNYNPVYSENPFSVDQLNTVVTVDPVKGKAGQKVKITAKVTDENGNPVPSGTVLVKLNDKIYKTTVKNGIATIKVVLPKAGSYNLVVYFEGDNNHNASYDVVNVKVIEDPSNSNLNPNLNSIGNMENTGNPLLVLLIALGAIGLESFRRKL